MDPIGDAILLRKYVAEQSEAAFTELVRRHLDAVYSLALRKVGGDRQLAEDATQMVFTALARKAPALGDRQVLGGWLYRATQLACAAIVRTERRRRAREQEANAMIDPPADSRAEVDLTGLRSALDHTLAKLGEAERDAIWLRFFEGRSWADIGARLNLPENSARMRVERALEKLRLLLSRQGITSSSAALGGLLSSHAAGAAPAGLAASVTSGALAGAAVETGLASGILLMSTTSKIAAASVALALVLGGLLTVRENQYSRELASRTTALNAAFADARAKSPVLPGSPAVAQAAGPNLEPPTAPAPSAAPSSSPGVAKTTAAQQATIRNNLRVIAVARDYYLQRWGMVPGSVEELISPAPRSSIAASAIKIANGEEYALVDLRASSFSVTAADGTVVTLDDVAPGKSPRVPTGEEVREYERQVNEYIPLRANGTIPTAEMAPLPDGTGLRISAREAGAIAVAEMRRRENFHGEANFPTTPQDVKGSWLVNLNLILERNAAGEAIAWGDTFLIWVGPDGKVSNYGKTKRYLRVDSN
jgi:RNA polymerase sigma factor (sigma-70 family)